MVRAPSASPQENQDPAALSGQGFHKSDNGIEKRHKVVSFGSTIRAVSPEVARLRAALEEEAARDDRPAGFERARELQEMRERVAALVREEERLYSYKHQRVDLSISKGSIPVGFVSLLDIDEGIPIMLETRDGGYNERDLPVGPQYQISWKDDVIAAPGSDGWDESLDNLWRVVLAHFERKNLVSPSTIEYLDADPFVLFGIDDPVTQQALVKLATFPSLQCRGSTPDFDEWAAYLRIDPLDSTMKWLVQAFAETDLPKPWTCYKGVGSIVCYIRSDSGQVTWKHPFYDYFRQLRDFCQQASMPEVMKVRCNRLLWSYEATRVETEHDQEPLVSPEYIEKLCDIFGYDIRSQGFLVRNLKAQLKVFARTYRVKQDVELEDVQHCAELLERDLRKHELMKEVWQAKAENRDQMEFELARLANGELECVNCGKVALSFCLECKDYLCLSCYDLLHAKGARVQHAPFRLVSCTLCADVPAKLHCTFTDKSLCHKCYAMRHIKDLPPDGKENQPRRIDYAQQYAIYAKKAQERAEARIQQVPALTMEGMQEPDGYDSVLSTEWHPFYDARGVKYHYNFTTCERMRQSPRRVPNVNDPGAEEVPAEMEPASASASNYGASGPLALPAPMATTTTSSRSRGGGFATSTRSPLKLTGFDAMKTDPAARDPVMTQPDLRALRPPHRIHMPHEVPTL